MVNGYTMKDIRHSKKLSLKIRRISCGKINYTIHPSFIMPYCTDYTIDAEKVLFLRKFDVPYWALEHVFGKNAMHWYRMENSLGRFSLVGTTVKNKTLIPQHLAGDEKHTKICGEKTYIATTVADECILGCEISKDAGTVSLEKSYKVFKDEVLAIDENYTPETINLDGWNAERSI